MLFRKGKHNNKQEIQEKDITILKQQQTISNLESQVQQYKQAQSLILSYDETKGDTTITASNYQHICEAIKDMTASRDQLTKQYVEKLEHLNNQEKHLKELLYCVKLSAKNQGCIEVEVTTFSASHKHGGSWTQNQSLTTMMNIKEIADLGIIQDGLIIVDEGYSKTTYRLIKE